MEEIKIYDISEVTGITYVDLACKYNQGYEGYMKMCISFCSQARKMFKKDDFKCDVIIKTVNEKIVGWAIVQDLLYKYKDFLGMNLYVLSEYRQQGHGSDIMKFMETHYSGQKISTWARRYEPNSILFLKFNKPPFYCFDMDIYDETGDRRLFRVT